MSYDQQKTAMGNQFQRLSALVGGRSIICTEKAIGKRTMRLRRICRQNGIPFESSEIWKSARTYIFLMDYPRRPVDEKVSVQWLCPLVPAWQFFPVSWNDFLLLAQGKYVFKSQEEYVQLLNDYDRPFEEAEQKWAEAHMDYLLHLGPEHHINLGILA